MGDLRRRQRREPARRPPPGGGTRCRSHAALRSSRGHSLPRRRSAADRSGDDPSRARLCRRKACRGFRRHDEPALRRRRRLLADRSDGGSPAASREPADRCICRGARGAPRCARCVQSGGGCTRCRPALDRRRCEGSSGAPRHGAHHRRRAATCECPRRGERAERASRQRRQDGQLLRDEGRGAAERELVGRPRVRDEGRRRRHTGHSWRESRVRCARRSRLRVGDGEGSAHHRARAHGRRNIIRRRVAYSQRALPRVMGRRARRGRHAQRRAAADPSFVRRTHSGRSAGGDGRRQGSSGLRHRA